VRDKRQARLGTGEQVAGRNGNNKENKEAANKQQRRAPVAEAEDYQSSAGRGGGDDAGDMAMSLVGSDEVWGEGEGVAGGWWNLRCEGRRRKGGF
jgi:hypothetical protein